MEKEDGLFHKWCFGKTGHSHEKMNLDTDFIYHRKINLKWITGLNVKLLEYIIQYEENLNDLRYDGVFLDITLKA